MPTHLVSRLNSVGTALCAFAHPTALTLEMQVGELQCHPLLRHCEELATKLRSNFALKRRSNPESFRRGILDCFVARAPRNDAVVRVRATFRSSPGRSAAPPAMRGIVRCGALQSRGPSRRAPCRSWVPALRRSASGRQGARVRAIRSAPLTIFWRCGCCHFSSRNRPMSLPATNRQRFWPRICGLRRVWQC